MKFYFLFFIVQICYSQNNFNSKKIETDSLCEFSYFEKNEFPTSNKKLYFKVKHKQLLIGGELFDAFIFGNDVEYSLNIYFNDSIVKIYDPVKSKSYSFKKNTSNTIASFAPFDKYYKKITVKVNNKREVTFIPKKSICPMFKDITLINFFYNPIFGINFSFKFKNQNYTRCFDY